MSCTREPDENFNTCYKFVNETDRLIQLEFYDYQNCGDFVFNVGDFSNRGVGLLSEKCKKDNFIPGPTSIHGFDSIIVKFDNSKRLIYLWNCSENPDSIYDPNFYELQRDGNSYNFIWSFTEEDFQNAEPY